MPKSLLQPQAVPGKISLQSTKLRWLGDDEEYNRAVQSAYTQLHLDRLDQSVAKPYLSKLTVAYAKYELTHKKAAVSIKQSRKQLLRVLAGIARQLKKDVPSTTTLTTRATQALLADDTASFKQAIAMGARLTGAKLKALLTRALPRVKSANDPLLARILGLRKLIGTENAGFNENFFTSALCQAIFESRRTDLVHIVPLSVYLSFRKFQWSAHESDQALAKALLAHGLDEYLTEHLRTWSAHVITQLFTYSPGVVEYIFTHSKVFRPWCRANPIELLTWVLGSLHSTTPTQLLPILAADTELKACLSDWSSYHLTAGSFSKDILDLHTNALTSISAQKAESWVQMITVFRSYFGGIKPPQGDPSLTAVFAEKSLNNEPLVNPLTTALELV